MRFELDGRIVESRFHMGFPFDAALMSPDGKYAVLYQKLGTKGIVLSGGKLVREINRSYCHAHCFEYPIAVFEVPDKRTVLAHCPKEYDLLEIEEMGSGRRLTSRRTGAPDIFHSRLKANRAGTYLLSAGWLWHPLGDLQLYSVLDVLKNPKVLDRRQGIPVSDDFFEIFSATFLGDDHLLVVGCPEDQQISACSYVAKYNIRKRSIECQARLETFPGTIMDVGENHFVGFYEYPKLFETVTGKVVFSWPDLKTGKQESSIVNAVELPPPMAMDSENKRFAVADSTGIAVVELCDLDGGEW